MKPAVTEGFRKTLSALETDLKALEEAARESVQPVALDQTNVGRLSRMDAMQTQEMALETSRRRQQQIVEIEGALRRIESGEYGSCFVCGEDIDQRRLEAAPASTRCVGCEEKKA